MLKKSFILVLLIGLITGFTPQLQAQEDDNEMNIAGPGADFIIAGGIYFGGKGPAGYYSGKPTNENNLNYIYGNKYLWKDQITRLIADNNNFVSPNDSLWISEYPEDMHYKPAMSITLGVSYRFNKHWRMTLYYSFARLVAKDVFSVGFPNLVPGNETNDYLLYVIMGKENRSFFDLTGSYTFHVNKVVKPFIELGAQFNFVRVKSFDAIIEDKTYNLLDVYGGQTYIPGAGMQELDTKYGGPGFGFMGAAGIKFAFNKGVSVDPCFYVSFGKVGLNGYKDFHFNYGAYVRLVMSDALFQR
ncbi:MAG: outer membrane beta-barrel protein [Bacteroidales bacterium]|nr:outer membrane beta-barrel protein [Bacteroidales bacterium]